MNPEITIKVSNLSKVYHMYDKPRHRLQQMLKPILGRMHERFNKQYFLEFYALRNINFELKKGESLGIIGRNGAGKSTLLQIISGILNPSEGDVIVNGRVNALLELGSGFNPEFTGRENVYLNGSILGFSKEFVDSKFQEIWDFSEIGSFIDQPVKTYSSGMFVRLAFAVQALLEPEILIIDEALSVGDIFFQNKCISYIQNLLALGNTTFIFVSHSTAAIQQYCKKTLFLLKGEQIFFGETKIAIGLFFRSERVGVEELKAELSRLQDTAKKKAMNTNESLVESNQIEFFDMSDTRLLMDDGVDISLTGYYILNQNREKQEVFNINETCRIGLRISIPDNFDIPIVAISLYNKDNITVFGKFTYQFKNGKEPEPFKDRKTLTIEYKLDLNLFPSTYIINVAIYSMLEENFRNLENFSVETYGNSIQQHKTYQLGKIDMRWPSSGLYLPFNGMTDLPSELLIL